MALIDKDHPEQLFAIAPLLALSATIVNGLIAGFVSVLLLVLTAITLSSARHFIQFQIRLPVIFLVITVWITLIEMGMKAYFYDMSVNFGIYLPLLAVNSLVFARCEDFYLKNNVTMALRNSLGTGLVLLAMFIFLGGVRELFSYGTVLHDLELVIPGYQGSINIIPGGLRILQTPAGAMLCCGLLLAGCNAIMNRRLQHQISS